ncbi:MAG TPA: sugar O-acetyltransferase [Ruminococcaceae bacterium]|nr:sugar O-acetyltransferase [Oscillospiraceae bacterium]
MSEQEKMHTQALYNPHNPEIAALQIACLERLYTFNHTRPSEQEKRQRLLHEMFAEIGEGCYLEPPFHANFGGRHVHFGEAVYGNFNLTLVDDTHIYVGSHTLFGPNVTVATAGHPISPELRAKGYQYNAPVTIGENCWIGAAATILPGVTLGDHVVVGAGSVVTKDLPSGVVAYGNPCKVVRKVNQHDRVFYFKTFKIDPSFYAVEPTENTR